MFVGTSEQHMREIAYMDVITFCLEKMNKAAVEGHPVLATQYQEIGNSVIAKAESEGYKVVNKPKRGKDNIVVLRK